MGRNCIFRKKARKKLFFQKKQVSPTGNTKGIFQKSRKAPPERQEELFWFIWRVSVKTR